MNETPQPPPVFAPPSEPRRPAWEVALLFAGIIAFLVLWGWAQWAAQTRDKYAGIRGLSETRMAERIAGMALAAKGPSEPALWQRAIGSYRGALKENPGLRRARRGLAAALYLNGDVRGARDVMRGPADFTDADPHGIRAWEATQAAFGALRRPARAAALKRDRAALQNEKLGWSRYVALMALSPDQADSYRARMVKEYGGAQLMWLGGAIFFVFVIFVPLGLYLLDRGLRLPRNLLPRLPVTTSGLVIAFVVALLAYQLVTGGVAAGVRILASGGTSLRSMASGVTMPGLVAGSFVGMAVAYGYAAGFLRRAGSSLAALGWRARDAVKWAIGGYIALFPLLAVSLFVVALLTRLFPNVTTPNNPAVDMVMAVRGPKLILVFLLVCVIAPLAEELLFRGLLFRGLEKRYGLLVGALAAGLLFGGMHPQLPFGFPPVFVLGVGLCYVYRISGSLVPGILMHAANNTMALVLALLTAGR